MSKRSESGPGREEARQRLIGLGERSLRKSYYPQLRASMDELRASEGKFRQIVQSSPMGIFLFELSEGGLFVFAGVNPAADHILGVGHQERIGKPVEEALPWLIADGLASHCRQTAAEGGSWDTEYREVDQDRIGRALHLHVFQSAPGKATVMFLDITRRKQVEGMQRRERGAVAHFVRRGR